MSLGYGEAPDIRVESMQQLSWVWRLPGRYFTATQKQRSNPAAISVSYMIFCYYQVVCTRNCNLTSFPVTVVFFLP